MFMLDSHLDSHLQMHREVNLTVEAPDRWCEPQMSILLITQSNLINKKLKPPMCPRAKMQNASLNDHLTTILNRSLELNCRKQPIYENGPRGECSFGCAKSTPS